MYRQGDVLLVPVGSLPDGATPHPVANHLIVLAQGGAGGHRHVIASDAVRLHTWRRTIVLDDDDFDPQFIEVEEPCLVTHEEHAPIALPPGLYRVVLQREFGGRYNIDNPEEAHDSQWRSYPVAD